MRGLSQNGKAIEAEARKSAPIRLFGLASSLNRRFGGARRSPLLMAIEQIAEFVTPGKTLIFYRNRKRIGRGNSKRFWRIRILWKLIQTPADEKRRSRLETMTSAEYDSPDDHPPRRGDRVADCAGLENQCARKRTQGSNPCLSARF
jgi:hypothetical protein